MAVGALHLLGALALARVLLINNWATPTQTLQAPWVEDVPKPLVLALLAAAAVPALTAVVLIRRVAGPEIRHRTLALVAVVVVAGAVAASWGALYIASIPAFEPLIPIFDWTFTAVPVLMATALAGREAPPAGATAVGLLAAAPIWSVSYLGWGVHSGPGAVLPALGARRS